MTEEKIREIIREEMEVFSTNFNKNSKENLAEKTEIIMKVIGKTLLRWAAIIYLIYFSIYLFIQIAVAILENLNK